MEAASCDAAIALAVAAPRAPAPSSMRPQVMVALGVTAVGHAQLPPTRAAAGALLWLAAPRARRMPPR